MWNTHWNPWVICCKYHGQFCNRKFFSINATFYFDNFSTSYDLLNDLGKKGVKTIGTVWENRTQGASKVLMDRKSLEKSVWRTFDFCCDGNLYFCKSDDHAIVSIETNFTSHIPVIHTKRRVEKDKDCSVTQPNLIKEYKTGMADVNVLDCLLRSYQPTIRSKK